MHSARSSTPACSPSPGSPGSGSPGLVPPAGGRPLGRRPRRSGTFVSATSSSGVGRRGRAGADPGPEPWRLLGANAAGAGGALRGRGPRRRRRSVAKAIAGPVGVVLTWWPCWYLRSSSGPDTARAGRHLARFPASAVDGRPREEQIDDRRDPARDVKSLAGRRAGPGQAGLRANFLLPRGSPSRHRGNKKRIAAGRRARGATRPGERTEASASPPSSARPR